MNKRKQNNRYSLFLHIIHKNNSMKFRICILMIIFGVVLGSCNKGKSFRQYKKEEREAIDALFAKEDFKVIYSYPANGVFGEKEFLKLDNECYLNVIDSGNGNRAIKGKTIVLMRCSYIGIAASDTMKHSIFPNSYAPLEFLYGNIDEAKYRASVYGDGSGFYYLSPGVESALEYVGDNATVRMIIPFDNGQFSNYPNGIGSTYQSDRKIPMYLDRIRFVFDEY